MIVLLKRLYENFRGGDNLHVVSQIFKLFKSSRCWHSNVTIASNVPTVGIRTPVTPS